MRKWKETKSKCEDSKRNYQNEAKKEKKIGKKMKSLSDAWDNIQLFNTPRIWVLKGEERKVGTWKENVWRNKGKKAHYI